MENTLANDKLLLPALFQKVERLAASKSTSSSKRLLTGYYSAMLMLSSRLYYDGNTEDEVTAKLWWKFSIDRLQEQEKIDTLTTRYKPEVTIFLIGNKFEPYPPPVLLLLNLQDYSFFFY